MTETYWCRIHDHYLDLPDDVVEITGHKKGWYKLVRFADRTAHDVRKTSRSGPHDNNAEKAAHTRWHKQPTDGCKFCRPEGQTPQADPEPIMGIGVTQARKAAEDLKQEQVEQKELLRETLTDLLVEPEQKSKPVNSTMAAAFERLRSNRNDN